MKGIASAVLASALVLASCGGSSSGTGSGATSSPGKLLPISISAIGPPPIYIFPQYFNSSPMFLLSTVELDAQPLFVSSMNTQGLIGDIPSRTTLSGHCQY